jgi:hypothetical protein
VKVFPRRFMRKNGPRRSLDLPAKIVRFYTYSALQRQAPIPAKEIVRLVIRRSEIQIVPPPVPSERATAQLRTEQNRRPAARLANRLSCFDQTGYHSDQGLHRQREEALMQGGRKRGSVRVQNQRCADACPMQSGGSLTAGPQKTVTRPRAVLLRRAIEPKTFTS